MNVRNVTAASFDRLARIETLERVLMTGDVIQDGDADALDEMLREPRAELARPVIVARATAHYPLPGGDLSADTATCTILQNEAGDLTCVNVAGEVADFTVEHEDYDEACEIAWQQIGRRYDSQDVEWTAEARALHRAIDQVR
jgi:hypothetical protein